MNPFTKLHVDICIRWLLTTAKVAVLFGLLLFLLSFCSCSSARKAEQVSVSSSDTISMVSAKVDSVGAKTSESSWFNRFVEISGLEIIFPASGKCSQDTADVVLPPPRHQPAKVHIDALKISESSGSDASAAMDSTSSSIAAEKIVSMTESSGVMIRSPTATKWQAVIVIVFVLLVIAYTAYQLYCSNSPRDQTDNP